MTQATPGEWPQQQKLQQMPMDEDYAFVLTNEDYAFALTEEDYASTTVNEPYGTTCLWSSSQWSTPPTYVTTNPEPLQTPTEPPQQEKWTLQS